MEKKRRTMMETWNMLEQSPFARFNGSIFFEENNDRLRFLTRDEILRLLEVSPPHLRNIIIAAIFTGLRKSDLLDLRWPGVDLERGFITYREQKKKGKLRTKAIPDDLIALLMEIPKGEGRSCLLWS